MFYYLQNQYSIVAMDSNPEAGSLLVDLPWAAMQSGPHLAWDEQLYREM